MRVRIPMYTPAIYLALGFGMGILFGGALSLLRIKLLGWGLFIFFVVVGSLLTVSFQGITVAEWLLALKLATSGFAPALTVVTLATGHQVVIYEEGQHGSYLSQQAGRGAP